MLAFISDLDEVRLTAGAIEAFAKTSTIKMLQSYKNKNLYIEVDCDQSIVIPPPYLTVLPCNVNKLTIRGYGHLEMGKGDNLCLTRLSSHALPKCEIRKIPRWFPAVLSGLKELVLSENYLRKLPRSFRDFSSLKSLDMARQYDCEFTCFSLENLHLPPSLEKLTLDSNYVPSIPDDVCSSLPLLKSLSINNLLCLPRPQDWFVQFLPPSINCMGSLTALDLTAHALGTLPFAFAELRHLTDIFLSKNIFSSFPLVLLSLDTLKRLDLSYNTITELPEGISVLSMLEALNMSYNRLRRIPVCLWSVDILGLCGNPLENVGEASMVKRTGLQRLSLPVDVLSMFDLTSLSSLSQLLLTRRRQEDKHVLPTASVTAKIAELQHLTELVTRKIELVTIPDEICLITSLQLVDVSHNQLNCLPQNIGRLTRLCLLCACHNEIRSASDQLWKIKSLTNIDLSNNLLTEIKPTAEYMKFYKFLDISFNNVCYLPTAFGELSLSQPMVFRCDVNPLLSPPSSLIPSYLISLSNAFHEVCSFMTAVKMFGAVRCGTLKVLVLGSYMAGKTSIVLSIINQQPSLTRSQERTISIDRFDWQVPETDGQKSLTVRFFDGGGQHTYAMSNQLFISDQAVNMIVIDAETYGRAENKCEVFQRLVGFYLDNLLDRYPAAVCVIVVAQADRVGYEKSDVLLKDIRRRCEGTLDRRIQSRIQSCGYIDPEDEFMMTSPIEEAKKHMSFVCMSAALDTATHSGMSQLQDIIASYGRNAELFPSVDYVLPRSWHSLEQHLEHHDDLVGLPYCMGFHLRKIASQLGLQNQTAKFVVSYLHNIGSVLFYDRDPVLREVVFHNLSFLISVFKAIFRRDIQGVNYDSTLSRLNMSPHRFKKLKTDLLRDGTATLSLIIALMESSTFERKVSLSRESVKIILRLLEYFDLCYWLTEKPLWFQTHKLEARAAECIETLEIIEDDHNRRLLIPWLLDRTMSSAPAEVSLYFGNDDPKCFVVVEASVSFRFHLPSALFDRLSARCHRHQTFLRHWSRGVLSVCGPVAMLLTEETETKSIVVKVKTPRSCESRKRIWQLLLRVLVNLKELCQSLEGAVSEDQIKLLSFNELNASFRIVSERQGYFEVSGYSTLDFYVSGHREGSPEEETLTPDAGTTENVKADLPLSACLPETMDCCLLPDDLRKAARLMGVNYKQFVISENLQESAITQPHEKLSATTESTSILALEALRKWQRCYGPFAVPCVLVESLCNAELADIAVQLFGYSIPLQEVAYHGSHEAAVTVDARALSGLVTRKQYIDVLDHLASVFESSWRTLGRSLEITNERLCHYGQGLLSSRYSIQDIVHEMVLEWYRRFGVDCTLAALLDKCERLQPNCRAELVSRIPKDIPNFPPLERLDLTGQVLEITACPLAFDVVSRTVSQTENWRALARRLDIYHTKDYESRYPLISDVVYDILEDWMRGNPRNATVRRLLDACDAVRVRGAVEHELKTSKIGLCSKPSCALCHHDE